MGKGKSVAAVQLDPAVIKVRVLVECGLGAPNDIVEIAALAASMDGIVDADPAAVEYAESLR